MTIGLYFGSFNPVHHGHLIIANHLLNAGLVDEVWFIVSPQNPFKTSAGLLNEHHRLHLVQLAIEGVKKLRASNIEFKLPKPSYTVNTLAYLAEKYPTKKFKILLGSDGFQNINNWHNAEALLKHYSLLVYKRPGFEITETFGSDVTVLEAPLLQISSTHIRKLIKEKKSIRFLVPDIVAEEIATQHFYMSESENPTRQ